MLIQDIFNI